MDTSHVGRTLSDFSIPSSQRAASPELGQQDFLKLMVEQMRNQNPLEPQDNSEFFSQIAQFQQLDAMAAISKAITTLVEISGLASSSALIGQHVTAHVAQSPDPETGFPRPDKTVSGIVERVSFDDNGSVLLVNGIAVPASAVVEIMEPVVEEQQTLTAADITALILSELANAGVLGTDRSGETAV